MSPESVFSCKYLAVISECSLGKEKKTAWQVWKLNVFISYIWLSCVDLEVCSKLAKCVRIMRSASKFVCDFDCDWQRVNVFSPRVTLIRVLLLQIISYLNTKVPVLVMECNRANVNWYFYSILQDQQSVHVCFISQVGSDAKKMFCHVHVLYIQQTMLVDSMQMRAVWRHLRRKQNRHCFFAFMWSHHQSTDEMEDYLSLCFFVHFTQ